MPVARYVKEMSSPSARALVEAYGVQVPADAVEIGAESIDFETDSGFFSHGVVLYQVRVRPEQVDPMLNWPNTTLRLRPGWTCADLSRTVVDMLGGCDPVSLATDQNVWSEDPGFPSRSMTVVAGDEARPVVTFLVYEVPL